MDDSLEYTAYITADALSCLLDVRISDIIEEWEQQQYPQGGVVDGELF